MALDDDNKADRDSQPDDDGESVTTAPAEEPREALKAKGPATSEDDDDSDDDDSDDDDSDDDDSDEDDADAGGVEPRGAAPKPAASESAAIDEDEDEDDDEALAAAARRRRLRKRAKKRRGRPALPQTEAELNTPSRAGALMVWIVGGVTLLLWLFARTACNFNPPQTEKPKLAELDVIAREPKGAAVEFEIRLREHRFAISEQLASASGIAVVQQAKQACGTSCPELEHGSILCQGSLLERSADGAKVRVECELAGKVDYQLLSVVREQSAWKVSAREPTVAPPPIGAAAVPPPTTAPPPVDTAAPAVTAPEPGQPTPAP